VDILMVGTPVAVMGIQELRMAGIIKLHDPPTWEDARAGPQVQPPEDSEVAAAMRAGSHPRYQRPLHRQERPAMQYPVRDPRPEPLTLDSLYDRMETGFDRM